MSTKKEERNSDAKALLDQYAEGRRRGLLSEYWHFLSHAKKWYLFPVVAALMVLGALIVIGGTAAAPFLYTLF